MILATSSTTTTMASLETNLSYGIPPFELYDTQEQLHWPATGRHILAHTTSDAILVYQAYNDDIADHTLQHQILGGKGFSDTRMTWIKTNFLWMMYRCGWGSKDANQARVLGFYIHKPAFLNLLSLAVLPIRRKPTSASKDDAVRLQWDPDHLPDGTPHTGRKAVQLGLRAAGLKIFREGTVAIVDMTDHLQQFDKEGRRMVPVERVFEVEEEIQKRLSMGEFGGKDQEKGKVETVHKT